MQIESQCVFAGTVLESPTPDGGGILRAEIDGLQWKAGYLGGTGSERRREEAEYDLRRWVGLVEQIRAYRRLRNRQRPLLTDIETSLAYIETADGPERLD